MITIGRDIRASTSSHINSQYTPLTVFHDKLHTCAKKHNITRLLHI